MVVIILCAGFGTRMYPLTRTVPKALLPVAGRPALDYLMDQITELQQIHDLILLSNGRFSGRFACWSRPWLPVLKKRGITFTLIDNGIHRDIDSRGAVKDLQFAIQKTGNVDHALIAASDNIFRFPLSPLWNQFLSGDDHRILALRETNPEKLKTTGVLRLTADNRVVGLDEKPRQPASNRFCPPLYFLRASAWNHLDAWIEKQESPDALGPFIDYLCRRETVRAIPVTGSRMDIGSLDGYQEANQILRRFPVLDSLKNE